MNESVFVERPPLAVKTNNSKNTDRPTYNKSIPMAEGTFRIASVQQHTRSIDETVVLNTTSIDRATHAPSDSTDAILVEEQKTVECKKEPISSEHPELESEVTESKRYATMNRFRHQKLANENWELQRKKESKANIESQMIRSQRANSMKPTILTHLQRQRRTKIASRNYCSQTFKRKRKMGPTRLTKRTLTRTDRASP